MTNACCGLMELIHTTKYQNATGSAPRGLTVEASHYLHIVRFPGEISKVAALGADHQLPQSGHGTYRGHQLPP